MRRAALSVQLPALKLVARLEAKAFRAPFRADGPCNTRFGERRAAAPRAEIPPQRRAADLLLGCAFLESVGLDVFSHGRRNRAEAVEDIQRNAGGIAHAA